VHLPLLITPIASLLHQIPRSTDTLLIEAPAKKKRKTGPVSADQVPADEDEVEEAEPQEDGIDDQDDSADDDEAVASGPASKAKQVKGNVVPTEDDLEEVDEVIAADEEDDE
jgi:hypothetical protein